MMNKLKKIIIILIFFIGFLIFMYPIASKIINNYLIQKTIYEYKVDIESINEKDQEGNNGENNRKELNELFIKMNEYNERIYNQGQVNLVDPFSYEVPSFDMKEFGFKENIIGYVTIPKMDIEVPIYLGATQNNMKKGAAHLSETSIPIGGINSNAVIAAHRGMKTHPMFRDIEMLDIGDDVIITNMWDELMYTVIGMKAINPNEISEVLIQRDKDLVTLITCHPYTQNYLRYVVYCERQIDYFEEERKKVEESIDDKSKINNIIKVENSLRIIGSILIIFFFAGATFKIYYSLKQIR